MRLADPDFYDMDFQHECMVPVVKRIANAQGVSQMLSDTLQGQGKRDAAEPTASVSLRDWFAGLALQEIMDANDGNLNTTGVEGHAAEWVQLSYQIADMMLEARESEGNMDRYEGLQDDQNYEPPYEADGGQDRPSPEGNVIDSHNSQVLRDPDLPQPVEDEDPSDSGRQRESGDQGDDEVKGFAPTSGQQ